MAETILAPGVAEKSPAPAQAHVEAMNHPVILSHGTLECRKLAASRRFYEEFLGLECVRHSKRSMKVRKGGYWVIVCLERGDHVRPLRVGNHWGLDLESREAVDRAHALALEHKERYGIQKITKVTDDTDTYQFYFMDLDGNWWEFQYAGEGQREGHGRNDIHFARGDVAPR